MPRARQKKPSSRRAWLLMAVFLLLVIVSLGLRYGDQLQRLGDILPGSSPEEMNEAPPAAGTGEDAPSTGSEPVAVVAPRLLRLQILNATGLNDLALQTGESLRAWDVDALDRGNAPAWPFPETLLIQRSGRRDAVEQLARRLGDMPVIVQRREDLMLDATLILGHDWEEYRWPQP